MEELVLIPAYKPDVELKKLVKKLKEVGLHSVVVNDGSGNEFDSLFELVSENATVITHEKNCGKGRALKTGMNYIKENYPECKYFITADADGQHAVKDILRVRDELANGSEFVLTTRLFEKNMPFRSKIGNDLSRVIFTFAAGRYYTDNQSGLRGFTTDNIDWLLKVKGEKYDYEMNMLYYASKLDIPVKTLDIPALYINGNSSSHFNPVKDTLRIYKLLFSSAKASLISLLLAQIMLLLVSIFYGEASAALCVIAVGIISSTITYTINRFLLFKGLSVNDGLRTFLFNITRFIMYIPGTVLLIYFIPSLPLIIAFDLCAIVGTVIRYYLHKHIKIIN